MDCSPPGSSVHGDCLGHNTGVGCHALLLQGTFPTQGWNLRLLYLLHWHADFTTSGTSEVPFYLLVVLPSTGQSSV